MAMGPAPTRVNPAGQRSDVPNVPDTLERLLQDAIKRGVKVVVVAANKARPIAHHDPSGRDAIPIPSESEGSAGSAPATSCTRRRGSSTTSSW